LENEINASLQQLKDFKLNPVWQELERGFQLRLEFIKTEVLLEPKIDKIRLLQGRAEELIYNLGLLDLMIESKKGELK